MIEHIPKLCAIFIINPHRLAASNAEESRVKKLSTKIKGGLHGLHPLVKPLRDAHAKLIDERIQYHKHRLYVSLGSVSDGTSVKVNDNCVQGAINKVAEEEMTRCNDQEFVTYQVVGRGEFKIINNQLKTDETLQKLNTKFEKLYEDGEKFCLRRM